MGKTIRVDGLPFTVSVEQVKGFLERHTGEGTICAAKIRQTKHARPRPYAIVQFNTVEQAALILSLANKGLRYGSSFLKTQEMERDIIPKPRTSMLNVEQVALHFGCQISNEKFKVLWDAVNVSVDFGFGMRRINFRLSHQRSQYRLELIYENIWQVELHRPRAQSSKYLLIQVALPSLIIG